MFDSNTYKKDRYFFNLALNLAQESTYHYRYGCIITYKGKPISLGVNKTKINPILPKFKKLKFDNNANERRKREQSTHAEIAAILKSNTNLINTTLYVARSLLKDNGPGDSFPCESCFQIIRECKIKSVVFWKNNSLKKIVIR